VLDSDPPTFRWFTGGVTNLSYNCLDLNVSQKGRGSHVALISENERMESCSYTYSRLLEKVKEVTAALRAQGVKKGDRVAIYLPTIPEAVIAMLAATRMGAIHLVVFAGFGSFALAERIRLAGAKVLLTSDIAWRKGKEIALWPIVGETVAEPNSPIEKVVVLNRTKRDLVDLRRGRDLDWNEFLEKGRGYPQDFEPMEANEPAYILATSGTTAKPKLAVHVHGGYQVWLRSTGDWLYRFTPSDVWWATADIGWAVGHSYIVYAPLLFGCTSIAYEGALDHPGPENFYRIVAKHDVTGLFVAPTGVRLLMKYGTAVSRSFDLGHVERVFCAGEVLNPPAWEWLQNEVFRGKTPVIDHMWQTETGGPIVANPYGLGLLPIKSGSSTLPLPGVTLEIRSMDGRVCARGEKGIVVIRTPFPGLTPTIWGDPERYQRDYWEKIKGVYFTGDAGYIDEDGYVWFSGRADEIIKIAAHRIGTIEVESALLTHPSVAEAGVVGRPDELRGEVISAFVVLRPNHQQQPSSPLRDELVAAIRKQIGAIAVVGEINFVSILPKTRSGKIMRRVLKAVILDKDPGDISTIEDEGSVEEARQAWKELKAELRPQPFS
jgi:acetyl-CoA synthetase